MTNPTKLNQMTDIAVLPKRDGTPAHHLDADAALELALYGATTCRMTSLESLINTVWCLTGGGWRPPKEVIADGLCKASAKGTILATESWVRSVPFYYRLTPKGAKVFRDLMNRPLPGWDDPISRSAATIKFGLLDVTDSSDLSAVVDDLIRFYLDVKKGLMERRNGLVSEGRPFLDAAMADRLAWVDQRLNMLQGSLRCEHRRRIVH